MGRIRPYTRHRWLRDTAPGDVAPPARLVFYADGGCWPNPGPARYGVVVTLDGTVIDRLQKAIGPSTNNVAEWRGALAALEYAIGYTIAYPERAMELRMDSQLVVNQLTGRYKAHAAHLKPLVVEGHALIGALRDQGVTVAIRWIPREQNTEADALT